MFGPLLALYCRSIREHTRHRMTPWTLAALVVVILLMTMGYQQAMNFTGAPGRVFFGMVVSVNVFFIGLASVSSFCSVITEEKEDGTLGLLRMTNLNPVSILLGKSTSRLTGALILIIAQFPFTLLAVTLGGVSLLQIYATYAVLIATTFFLCNLALLGSVISRNTRKAVSFTTFIGFVLYMLLPGIYGALSVYFMGLGALGVSRGDSLSMKGLKLITDANPLSALFQQIEKSTFAGPVFGLSFWAHLIGGIVCFGLAVLSFNRFCSETPEPVAKVIKPKNGGAARRMRRPGKSAMAWKDFHFLYGGRKGIVIRCLVYAALIVIYGVFLHLSSNIDTEDFSWMLLFWSVVIVGFEMVNVASSMFSKERKWQTLSSIVTLPVSTGRILGQKLRGGVPLLIPSLALIVLAALVNAKPHREICLGVGNFLLRALNGDEPVYAIVAIIYAILQALLFLVLIVNLSLRIKRGAVGVAIGCMFVFHFASIMLMGVLRFDMSSWALTTVIVAVFLVVTFVQLFTLIPKVAAED